MLCLRGGLGLGGLVWDGGIEDWVKSFELWRAGIFAGGVGGLR